MNRNPYAANAYNICTNGDNIGDGAPQIRRQPCGDRVERSCVGLDTPGRASKECCCGISKAMKTTWGDRLKAIRWRLSNIDPDALGWLGTIIILNL